MAEKGVKRILGNIAYVCNNPVAGKMSRKAIDNRWTLLAYYNNPNPFSEPIEYRTRSRAMIRAMKIVDLKYENDEYLDYVTQKRIFAKLNTKERKQIIDYIITKYNFIDYNAMIDLYGSFEKALIAIDSNAGAEYDQKDDCGDHSCYRDMLRIVKKLGYKDKRSIRKRLNPLLEQGRIAMTTDGFIVSPQEFPGGNIGLSKQRPIRDLSLPGRLRGREIRASPGTSVYK